MINTIYYEKHLIDHERASKILSKFSKARLIEIDRFGEVFNKRDQNFRLQKQNPALILAEKYDNFVLKAPVGFGIGVAKNFYFSHMYNCIYDCRYCFLQGLYASANYVLFVNFEDFDKKIEDIIHENKTEKTAFFSGYDCDSLALENITGFVKHTLPLFRNYPNSLLEIRTKSVQLNPLLSTIPFDNCVVAYSLMPDLMSKALDDKAPPVKARIDAMVKLSSHGWKLGFRFDPLIHGENWKYLYGDLIDRLFENISPNSIHSVSFGTLRFPKKMFKKMQKLRPQEKAFVTLQAEGKNNVSYKEELQLEMIEFCKSVMRNYVKSDILFDYMSEY